MNVIILSNINWGFLKQRHHYFVDALSSSDKVNNIIYLESTGKRLPTLSDIPRIFKRIFRREQKSSNIKSQSSRKLNIISPVTLPSTNYLFNSLNKKYFLKKLKNEINKYLGKENDIVFLVYLPSKTSLNIIKLFDNKNIKVVYDCVTNYSSLEGISPGITHTEEELVVLSDEMIVDCDYLFRKFKSKTNHVNLIEPIVEFELFNQADSISKSMKSIVYYGLVSEKLDFQAINTLLDAGLTVKVIGPIRSGIKLDNRIQYIGQVDHKDLPRHINNGDALIIPYINNEFMKGVIPAKLFECMATGKPIFAPNMENFKYYNEYLNLYEDHNDLLYKVKNYKFDIDQRNKCILKAKERDSSIVADQIKEILL